MCFPKMFNFRIVHIFLSAMLVIFTSVIPLAAETVLVRYDIILDSELEIQQSPYIEESSIDIEGLLMENLFESGHIVFNMLGDVYVSENLNERSLQHRIAENLQQARKTGAGHFVYMDFYYEDVLSEDLRHLSMLDYEIVGLGSQASTASTRSVYSGKIRFAESPKINALDASKLLFQELREKNWRLIQ